MVQGVKVGRLGGSRRVQGMIMVIEDGKIVQGMEGRVLGGGTIVRWVVEEVEEGVVEGV